MDFHPPLRVRLKKQPSPAKQSFRSSSLPASSSATNNPPLRGSTDSSEGNRLHVDGSLWSKTNSDYNPSKEKSSFLDHDSFDGSGSCNYNSERASRSRDEFESRNPARSREKIDYKWGTNYNYYNEKNTIIGNNVEDGSYDLKKLNHRKELSSANCFSCRGFCMFMLAGLRKAKKKKRELSDKNGIMFAESAELKFDCGSWSSSAIMQGSDLGGMSQVITAYSNPLSKAIKRQNSKNSTRSPASNTAFVSNREVEDNGSKSVPCKKNFTSSINPRILMVDSNYSQDHARLSTCSSSPAGSSCSRSSLVISPRLRKARDDFNSLLKSQTINH